MYPLKKKNYAESILVVNNIPGAGRVAASINLPLLAAAQLIAAVLPTLILSSFSSEKGNVVRYPMAQAYHSMLDHWQEIGYHFDAILTGYFADVGQIDHLAAYYLAEKEKNPQLKLIMDPIMGDHGKFYKGFDENVATHLRELIQYADIVMPNITEACFILNKPYRADFDREDFAAIAHELLTIGADTAILTGAVDKKNSPGKLGFYYASKNGEENIVLHDYFDGQVFGTGDTVISTVAGNYLAGQSIETAVRYTSQIVEQLLHHSIKYNDEKTGPIHFEPFIKEIAGYFLSIRNELGGQNNVK